MHFSVVTVVTALSSLALAGVVRRVPGPHAIHEKRDHGATDAWQRVSRAERNDIIPVRIALKERNLENAEKFILDVSHPESKNYAKHWTAEEVANTFRPSKETNNKVVSWLEDSGIELSRISHSAGRNWIQFDATIEEAEQLFKTDYHTFEHVESGNRHPACDDYSLPLELRDHIDFVFPTIHLGNLKRHGKRNIGPTHDFGSRVSEVTAAAPTFTGLTGLKNCDQIITIDCLRAIYNFPAGSTAHASNIMGIAEWDQYLNITDLHVFFKNLTSPVIPQKVVPEFVSIDGGKKVYGPHGTISQEANLVFESAIDFQTSYSIIYPQNTRWYAVGDGVNVNSVGTFNIFLDALDASYCTYEGGDSPKYDPHYPDPKKGGYKGKLQCGGAPISNVVSISYGQEEVNLPPAYQIRQCHEYMKLGLQGMSVIIASGDSGVAQRYNAGFDNKCLEPHSNKKSVNGTRFSPGFPVNCPYVTSVGATDLLTKSIHGGERAVSDPQKNPELDFYSGGGFSNVFTLPSYQKQAVTHYLTKYPPPYSADQFNKSGNARGYPDVAALGIQIATVFDSQINNFGGGTSASAPIVGGIVTLLNEARLSAGKKAVGFLNPVFYANPDAFNDVTVGNNPGCGTKGFSCQPGWDPVTGLGTPNFEKLKAAFLALP